MRRYSLVTVICVWVSLWINLAWANVSYLGPAGTYTEEAAIRFFGVDEVLLPAASVPEALALLKAGKSEFAVVPVENTIGGPVYTYLDAVLADHDLAIVGEVDLPIRQTLLAMPGVAITDIKTVLSHPQGLAQSKAWLKEFLPEAKLVEVASTAEAAKRVAEAGDVRMAAIAASRTAEVYHLAVVANDLQITQTNVTRFWIVAAQDNIRKTAGHKAVALVAGSNQAVITLVYELTQLGYTVQALHDRPTQQQLGSYQFLVEVAGSDPTAALEKLLASPNLQVTGRVLGNF